MNIFREAEQIFLEQREEFMSENITYFHAETEKNYTLPATLGKTIFKSEDYTGIVTRVHGVDFIVATEHCDFEPQRGDIINLQGRKFEVLAPNGEPVWRWQSGNHLSIRIHTKEIGGK